jgi:enoyl-CoA hydratase/carnithine racemase
MNSFKEILYDVRDRICTITLNRPDRLNATTDLTQAEVRRAAEQADADDKVRLIILTGAGRGFCAGADMATLDGLPPDDILRTDVTRPFDMNRRSDYQSRFGYFPAIRKPIIAAINGPCAGLGMVYAMYCDVRFASDKAVFSTAFSRRGLIAEHGTSWMLPLIVGHANAMDILLSARKFDAAEALRMNFVTRVFPPEQLMEATRAYAADLAENVSPRSMRAIKRQLYEVPFQTLAEAIMTANREMYESTRSEDFREGVAHYIEKRKPRFTGR